MAVGDGLILRLGLVRESSAGLWCTMTVRERSPLRWKVAVGGSGATGESGSLRPLALKVARVSSNTSGKGVQNCDPLLALFSIQSPYAQGRQFAILAIFFCVDPPDG